MEQTATRCAWHALIPPFSACSRSQGSLGTMGLLITKGHPEVDPDVDAEVGQGAVPEVGPEVYQVSEAVQV